MWIVRWENGRGRCVLALQCARGLRLPSGAGRVLVAKTTSSRCRECCAVLSVYSSPCSRGQIALNGFDFSVLNPALQTGIVLQNPSLLGSRTAVDGEGGISPSPARVCGLCTCGGIRCEVPASSGILFQRGDTQRGTFLWGVTQTLWSRLPVLCVKAAMILGSRGAWGSWEANPASTGPVRALISLTASCAEAGGLPQSCWEHQQAVQLPGTGFGTICHKSHGGRTQRAELLFPWQREGADKLLTLYKVW